MRKVLSVILSLSFMWSVCYQSSLVVAFYWNQGYIIDEHCENKNKPELECHGQCYLSKKLAEAEEDTNIEVVMASLKSEFQITESNFELFSEKDTFDNPNKNVFFFQKRNWDKVNLSIPTPPPNRLS